MIEVGSGIIRHDKQDGNTVGCLQNLNMADFKILPYRTNVTHQKKLHAYPTYVLFIGWYALNVPYLKGTVRMSIQPLNVPCLRGTVRK